METTVASTWGVRHCYYYCWCQISGNRLCFIHVCSLYSQVNPHDLICWKLCFYQRMEHGLMMLFFENTKILKKTNPADGVHITGVSGMHTSLAKILFKNTTESSNFLPIFHHYCSFLIKNPVSIKHFNRKCWECSKKQHYYHFRSSTEHWVCLRLKHNILLAKRWL